jgi:tetratricopeptide (TPR) repeat protein
VRVTDLRGYLRSLDAETLAELLHEQAERDPDLHARLQLRAGSAAADADAAGQDEPADLLDRQAGSGETTKIVAVLDTLQRLLDAGTQADLAPLARRTVDRIVEAPQDDPAVLRRAIALYARACAARPPADLADWIASMALGHGAELDLAAFAGPLGDAGLAHLKSIVDERSGCAAERLAEQLAELSGDVDALLEILSRQPQRLDVRLKIVRVLRGAGRTAEAVAYAAKALNQSEEKPELDPGEHLRALIAQHKRQVEHLIEQKDAAHYEQAAKLLRKIRQLYRKAGIPDEFGSYLTELITTHKRKARFIAEIRQARIALPKG